MILISDHACLSCHGSHASYYQFSWKKAVYCGGFETACHWLKHVFTAEECNRTKPEIKQLSISVSKLSSDEGEKLHYVYRSMIYKFWKKTLIKDTGKFYIWSTSSLNIHIKRSSDFISYQKDLETDKQVVKNRFFYFPWFRDLKRFFVLTFYLLPPIPYNMIDTMLYWPP